MMTLADLRTEARDSMLDVDSNNYSIDATTLDRMLNKAIVIVKGIQDDRPVDMTATVSGMTFAANTKFVTTSVTNIRRILAVFRSGSAGSSTPTSGPLEQLDDWELQQAQDLDPFTGTPSMWAAWRAGTSTAADVGKWTVALWRVPDATKYFILRALVEPTVLSSGTDKPDMDDDTAYACAWMAAAIGARLMGRDEAFIGDIKARIPDVLQASYSRMQRDLLGVRDAEKRQ